MHSNPRERIDRMEAEGLISPEQAEMLRGSISVRPTIAPAAALAPVPSLGAPARTIPMRDFFRNPEQTAHQISPDGKYVSWLAPWERRLNVHVRPFSGGLFTSWLK